MLIIHGCDTIQIKSRKQKKWQTLSILDLVAMTESQCSQRPSWARHERTNSSHVSGLIVASVAGELGVGPTEGGEVMDFLDSLKADIVTA
jgi:hypothetical protein